jgi:DNA-binding response OmpR family regulator
MKGAGILIIEDDNAIRESLQEFLSAEGYSVFTARDGLEALETLRTTTPLPKMIILDINMPNMDGWDFLEERRKLPNNASRVPVVVVSATRVIHRHSDMNEVLAKPFRIEQILTFVKKYCA